MELSKRDGMYVVQLYMTMGSKILAVYHFLSTANIVLGSLILTRSRNSISPPDQIPLLVNGFFTTKDHFLWARPTDLPCKAFAGANLK